MPRVCFVSLDVEPDFGRAGFIGVEHLSDTLDILVAENVPATLFVCGEVLAKYKTFFKELAGSFEIAGHGFSHRFWDTLSPQARMAEIESFKLIYEEAFGQEPRGFRAPSHIIDEDGLAFLEKSNFAYDSSVVPHYPFFKKYRGYKGPAPLLPYYPSTENYRAAGSMNILEVPNTGQLLGLPLAGAWLKKIPFFVYQFLFAVYRPSFVSLSAHSWNVLDGSAEKNYDGDFLKKFSRIIALLKKHNYQFLNGEQIFYERAKFFGN